MKLLGQVAVITGGSRGIGRGISLAPAEAGADIVVNYRKDEKAAQEVVAKVKEMGRRAFAVFFCSKAVLEYLRQNKKRNIINISSMASSLCQAGHSPYAIAKAGLDAFTKVLAKEEGPHGIRVNGPERLFLWTAGFCKLSRNPQGLPFLLPQYTACSFTQ